MQILGDTSDGGVPLNQYRSSGEALVSDSHAPRLIFTLNWEE